MLGKGIWSLAFWVGSRFEELHLNEMAGREIKGEIAVAMGFA